MKLFYVLLILISCQTQPKKFEPVEKPVDYDSFVKEAEEKLIFPASFGKGDYTDTYYTALDNLTKCSNYSKEVYTKYDDCRKAYDRSASLMQEKDSQIKALTEELAPWREIKHYWTVFKWTLIGFVVLSLLGSVIYFFRDTILALIKVRV